MSDTLLKFLFQGAPVRGGVVRLDSAWRQMTEFHDYPSAVTKLLGEMTAAAALLATNIKFNGALILQIHGDGPVKLLVVECQADLRLRATAKLNEDVAPGDTGLQSLVNTRGRGRCVITLDPIDRLPGQLPYQGVVPLEGDSIAQALEAYLQRSEQLDSRLWLAADAGAAAGLLLQKLPHEGGRADSTMTDEDAWTRTTTLAATLSRDELLSVAPDALTHRLFWQEKLEPYAPLAPRFECSCSRDRIGRMLVSLGRDEVEDIVAAQGRVEVTCDFCNARRVFDAVDVGQLFFTGSTAEPSLSRRPH